MNAPVTRQNAPGSPDFPPAEIVHVWLNRGRDNAEPIGSLAERLKLTRRQVEAAVQELRLRGVAVCSGPDGVFIGDRADLEETIASLRGRLVNQYQTYLALRRTLRRMDGYQQTTLGWEDAA